jgi:hypothetical protein
MTRLLRDLFLAPLWLVLRTTCELGWHCWVYNFDRRVPFYGVGCDECIICDRIKVNPLLREPNWWRL